ncbi:MAG TPA: ankyrin repeat domain-containing protein [Candidatus Babeliales bacterium]|nr:ankyrin repeat domain-containing protein [Candidatus Babeliales bacterium]
MQMRRSLAVSIGFKIGILLLCASLLYGQRLMGADYFNPTLSVEVMRQAVQAAENVDAFNQFGYTGLMVAASDGRLPLAKALVKNGAHLNMKSVAGQYQGIANKTVGLTALHCATNNLRIDGSKQVGYYLISVFADVRLTDGQGNTPLHLVVSTDVIDDRTAMAEALIKNGADINAQNEQGDTLFHLAVNLDAQSWIQDLAKKFGPLINDDIKNKKGLTPYDYAKQLGFGDTANIIKALKVVMPKAEEYNPVGLTGLMLAVMKGDQSLVDTMAVSKALNMKSRDQYKNSALHIALPFGNLAAVKTLVDKGALLGNKNADGDIPLQFVPRIGNASQRIQAAQLLLKKAPNTLLSQNNDGENFIHTIVRLDDQELLADVIKEYRALAQKAALVKNKKLQSPLQLATQMRRKEIVNQLQGLRSDVVSIKK